MAENVQTVDLARKTQGPRLVRLDPPAAPRASWSIDAELAELVRLAAMLSGGPHGDQLDTADNAAERWLFQMAEGTLEGWSARASDAPFAGPPAASMIERVRARLYPE